MVDFSDEFPDDELMLVLGDDIIYIPKVGGRFAIKAIVDHNVERVGNDGYSIEKRTEIEFLSDQITNKPQRGDYIEHKTQTYRVDSQSSNDGDYTRVAVSLYHG